MDCELVRKTEEFVRQRFYGDGSWLAAHPDALAYRMAHTYRVANIGRQIASQEGFDETEMTIACLLHDVSYCEAFGADGWNAHGRRAAQIARSFLAELGLAGDRIDEICFGIAIHVDDVADVSGERTPFALTVGDADNLDRFDAYRIHETLSHDGFLTMPLGEKADYVSARLRRLGELRTLQMATQTAERLWDERISFYTVFYEKLDQQLKSSTCIFDGNRI